MYIDHTFLKMAQCRDGVKLIIKCDRHTPLCILLTTI